MARNSTWRRRLVVPLLAGAAVALPLGLRADGSAGLTALQAQEACPCWPAPDEICFVNGEIHPGVWEGA